ncbi:Acireductone dioxygenase [Enhygromyxa salina]|uniref:acireductone dioxygenase (Fe(2+)-requiring) n=1 Tax=Enhygromyxa salina TaxID=215803 RepID=A0A2S9YHU2_9BACT|nr:cupin domain-containing protein [Enhygromyxa salina]PRQ04687.1 Acireductone dioxygenase [Enhygromyxa salina]
MQLAWIDPQPDYPALDVAHLRSVGVTYEQLELADDAYQPALDALKRERGYIEQDVIALAPETDNLDAICAKFADEHLHTDDEVRFVLAGEGIFDIRDDADRWMRVTVEAGDLIVVPKDRHHRFFLTDSKQIRCVRLFQDSAGWVPHYR